MLPIRNKDIIIIIIIIIIIMAIRCGVVLLTSVDVQPI